jgi:hypothetical protein
MAHKEIIFPAVFVISRYDGLSYDISSAFRSVSGGADLATLIIGELRTRFASRYIDFESVENKSDEFLRAIRWGIRLNIDPEILLDDDLAVGATPQDVEAGIYMPKYARKCFSSQLADMIDRYSNGIKAWNAEKNAVFNLGATTTKTTTANGTNETTATEAATPTGQTAAQRLTGRTTANSEETRQATETDVSTPDGRASFEAIRATAEITGIVDFLVNKIESLFVFIDDEYGAV